MISNKLLRYRKETSKGERQKVLRTQVIGQLININAKEKKTMQHQGHRMFLFIAARRRESKSNGSACLATNPPS